MTESQKLTADADGARLDKYLVGKVPDLSRAHIQELIREGRITVNGSPVKPSHPLKSGDLISLEIPPPLPIEAMAENIHVEVVYEDANLAVINKPAGLTTHPAPGHTSGTLLNALLARFPELVEAGGERPGIVHRLDKDTSGLMVVARSRQIQAALSEQFKLREVTKVYLALVKGNVEPAEGIIEASIGRAQVNRKKMAVTENGREARSQFKVVQRFKGHTLLEIRIFTGRTHQIRVHLAAIGYPVVGDTTYGVKSERFPRQFLHAHRLAFRHPVTGAAMTFSSDLPADLAVPLSGLT
ncbi:MAG: RluA family pseudouridine synthase [Dehalogenimonas sp.]|uniref:Pseudouridine synthase n=1 Tax=Candidatus Dehalogenimonas loeffleri TaxID=3127115 RepID=A0ABZ2J152_9CHLR|nr:RluA family pseudouridine synthase [Dehalogenimonas sp.]